MNEVADNAVSKERLLNGEYAVLTNEQADEIMQSTYVESNIESIARAEAEFLANYEN